MKSIIILLAINGIASFANAVCLRYGQKSLRQFHLLLAIINGLIAIGCIIELLK